jgi:hypothetical protein
MWLSKKQNQEGSLAMEELEQEKKRRPQDKAHEGQDSPHGQEKINFLILSTNYNYERALEDILLWIRCIDRVSVYLSQYKRYLAVSYNYFTCHLHSRLCRSNASGQVLILATFIN